MNDIIKFQRELIKLVNKHSYCSGEYLFPNSSSFIEDLNKIMPPICTENERKFLDEIRDEIWIHQEECDETALIEWNLELTLNKKGTSITMDDDSFPQIDLKEFVNKKE